MKCWQACEKSCSAMCEVNRLLGHVFHETWTDVTVTGGNNSAISVLPFLNFSSCFPLLHHTVDALRCTAGTCGLTAYQSQEKLNIVCVSVHVCLCLSMKEGAAIKTMASI